MKYRYERAKLKIAEAWEENPLGVITVGALVAGTAVKVLEASTRAKNARAWEKEVDRRRMKDSLS